MQRPALQLFTSPSHQQDIYWPAENIDVTVDAATHTVYVNDLVVDGVFTVSNYWSNKTNNASLIFRNCEFKKRIFFEEGFAISDARIVFEHSKVLTDRQMFEGIKTDKAQMLAHWMGKEEFFFCHWYAESEEAIYRW